MIQQLEDENDQKAVNVALVHQVSSCVSQLMACFILISCVIISSHWTVKNFTAHLFIIIIIFL